MIKKSWHKIRRGMGWYADSDRGLVMLSIFLILYLFVIFPLMGGSVFGQHVVSVVFSLILMAGVWAAATHNMVRIGVTILAGLSFGTHWLNVALSGRTDHMIAAGSAVLFFALLTWFLSLRVFYTPGTVNWYQITGAVAIYLVIGLMWSEAYLFIYLYKPTAFHFASEAQLFQPPTDEMLYFSFSALTTQGFGDITAVHPVARSLVMMEGLVGQLFPAIVLARLVTRYHGMKQKEGDS